MFFTAVKHCFVEDVIIDDTLIVTNNISLLIIKPERFVRNKNLNCMFCFIRLIHTFLFSKIKMPRGRPLKQVMETELSSQCQRLRRISPRTTAAWMQPRQAAHCLQRTAAAASHVLQGRQLIPRVVLLFYFNLVTENQFIHQEMEWMEHYLLDTNDLLVFIL